MTSAAQRSLEALVLAAGSAFRPVLLRRVPHSPTFGSFTAPRRAPCVHPGDAPATRGDCHVTGWDHYQPREAALSWGVCSSSASSGLEACRVLGCG